MDFINLFLEYTDGRPAPFLFRQWSGIALVAGALERRVWAKAGALTTFPNLYTMLVAPPGVGKFVIEEVRELWSATGGDRKRFHVAADSVTRASLIDGLAEAHTSAMPPGATQMLQYHSLLVAAEEAGVLLPSYDTDFIGALNSIYNNKETPYVETRRHGRPKTVSISQAQLNILMGAQPGWLATTFPEEAWTMGFTSRIIMVYASEGVKRSLFFEPGDTTELRKQVLKRLEGLADLYGPMKWREDAAEYIEQWDGDTGEGGPPHPTHSKLVNYVRRRSQHAIKLSIISAISRTADYVIELEDVKRAISWLLEAERVMPDIFRAMVGKSDVQVIEELHHFVTQSWMRGGRKAIHERTLYEFLAARVPSDKVGRIIEIAQRSGYIEQQEIGGTLWLPRLKPVHGVE